MKVNKRFFIKILIILLFGIFILFCNSNNVLAINDTQTIEDGIYIIKSAINEQYVFDIYNNSKENGANLELWENNKGDNQKFKVEHVANGYYTISSVHSNKRIDVENNSNELGANVLQWQNNEGDNQKWLIKKTTDGYYNIISKCNELYLDIPYSKTSNGANVQMWFNNGGKNQKFKFEKQNTANDKNQNEDVSNIGKDKKIDNGVYTIKSALNEGYVFDIYNNSKDNGSKLELWTDGKRDNQRFYVVSLGNNCYSISPINSQKKLDVEGNSKELSTNIIQWENNGADNQKWLIKDAGNGYCNIISKSSGLYLDIPNSNARDGVSVQTWFNNGGRNQMFKFEKQSTFPGGNKTIGVGTYAIKLSTGDNDVLDVMGNSTSNGGDIGGWNDNSTSNQKFRLKYLGNGYYTIYASHSGKYLTVEGSGTKNGAKVVQWQYTGSDSQQWVIKELENGYYNIISKASGLYMSIENSYLKVYKADNSNNQKFKFIAKNTISINNSKYPGYKELLEQLITKHPSWDFELLYTGISFKDAVNGEKTVHSRNLVETSNNGEWVCPTCGTKLYDSGWYCASEKAIAYYMDSRNFLDEVNVFQFLNVNLYPEDSCSIEGIKTKLRGTFLENYAYDVNNACKNTNVNPYYIIARLIQEQGNNGTTIGKGMNGGDGKTYYNPFNIGASGNGYDNIYNNALKRAKQEGWDSMQKAIEGGIAFCKKNWLENYQNTLYQNKFDIDKTNGTPLYEHQYMQNLLGAYSEGRTLANMYRNTGKIDSDFTFIIPVYENMSSTLSPKPVNSSNNSNIKRVTTSDGTGCKLRDNPGLNSNIISYLNEGTSVTIIDDSNPNYKNKDGYDWAKVKLSNGTEGFIATKFLR